MKVLKYTLQQHGASIVEMPAGAKLLHVGNQCGALQLWVEADLRRPREARRILVAFTGEELPKGSTFIGTWLSSGGSLVAHVYELDKEKGEDHARD